MPVMTTTFLVATSAAIGMSTAAGLATAAAVGIGVYGAIGYSMNRSNMAKKDANSAALDAQNKSLALAQEQRDAEENASLQAMEDAKARRRELTKTIFSQQTDQYGISAGGKTQLGVA